MFKISVIRFYFLCISFIITSSNSYAIDDSLRLSKMLRWVALNQFELDSCIRVSCDVYHASKELGIKSLEFKAGISLAKCYEYKNDSLQSRELYEILKQRIDSVGTMEQEIELSIRYAWFISLQGEVKESIDILQACLDDSRIHNNYLAASINYYMSTIEFNAGYYEESLIHSLNALEHISTSSEWTKMLIYEQIGILYLELGIYDKSSDSYRKALSVASRKGYRVTTALYGLGMCDYKLEKYKGAYLYFDSLVGDLNETWSIYFVPTNAYLHQWKCMIDLDMEDAEKTAFDFIEATEGKLYQKRTAYVGVMQAEILIYYNKLDKAEEILRKSMMVIDDLEVSSLRTDYYYWMSLVLEKQNRHEESLHYYKKHNDNNDSIMNIKVLNKIAILQEDFDAVERDNEIISLGSKLEKEKLEKILLKSRLFLLMVSGIVLLLIIAFIAFYLRSRHNYRLLAMKVKYDQKESDFQQMLENGKIRILQSNIQGQERERNRLAKELHDDLGSKLTSLRYFVSSKKGHFVGEDSQVLKVELLEVQKYIRNLSHQLVIPKFHQFSLPQLIQEQKNWINNDNVDFSFDFDQDINWAVVTEEGQNQIYRIIQEAVSNSLKHSEAKEIRVAGFLRTSQIDFEISDNGIGFDDFTSLGMGLKNIKERAQIIGSEIKFHIVKKGGTKISFSYPLN